VRPFIDIMCGCVEGPRGLFPLPQATLVGDRAHTLPRFHSNTTGAALGCPAKATDDRWQTKDRSFVTECNGTSFPLPLALSHPNGPSRRRLEMCVCFLLPTALMEQTVHWTGPSCDTFGGMCTRRGPGSPRSHRRTTATRRTRRRTG
jgi:hypothetical protein